MVRAPRAPNPPLVAPSQFSGRCLPNSDPVAMPSRCRLAGGLYAEFCTLRITMIERLPEDTLTLHAEMLALLLSQEVE